MLVRIVWLSVIRKGRVDVALVRGRDSSSARSGPTWCSPALATRGRSSRGRSLLAENVSS